MFLSLHFYSSEALPKFKCDRLVRRRFPFPRISASNVQLSDSRAMISLSLSTLEGFINWCWAWNISTTMTAPPRGYRKIRLSSEKFQDFHFLSKLSFLRVKITKIITRVNFRNFSLLYHSSIPSNISLIIVFFHYFLELVRLDLFFPFQSVN